MSPPDSDKLDVEQAFAALVQTNGENTWKARIGRQQMAWDLQRFVALRDGPNVRQSFDAIWGDWERGPLRVIGYISRPVQNRDLDHFDDTSNGHQRFNGIRLEYQGVGPGDVSGSIRATSATARALSTPPATRRATSTTCVMPARWRRGGQRRLRLRR